MWLSMHNVAALKTKQRFPQFPSPSLPQAWQWAVYGVAFIGPREGCCVSNHDDGNIQDTHGKAFLED